MKMTPLKVVAFFDGRLGHEKQTHGVVNALARRTPIEIVEKRHVAPLVSSTLINWVRWLAVMFPGAGSGQSGPVDLIVGTGTHVHIPMLLLKRSRGGRAVTCMTPDVLLRRHMDLCFVPVHDQVRPDRNIFTTIGPPGISTDRGIHESDRGLILIGGIDPKSHVWDSEEVFSQVKAVIEKDASKKWTITSSPRTPEEMCVLLEHFAAGCQGVSFLPARETPRGWIEEAYDRNECVWVTADSVSMVYEALTAGCRVGIFPMRWKKEKGKFHRSEQFLIKNGMVTNFESWISGKSTMIKPKPLNEAARCAEEILKRWWAERLK